MASLGKPAPTGAARLRIGPYHADLTRESFAWTHRTSAADLVKLYGMGDTQVTALDGVSADFATGAVPQAALAALLRSGVLARHVRRMRRLYAERQRAMLDALARHMPAGARWSAPPGGHMLWLRLPAVDPDRVFYDAAAEGIAYTRGEVFHFDGRGTDCLALSFANLTPPRIADGVALFAAVVRRQVAPGRRRSRSARGPGSEQRRTRRAPGDGGTVDAVGTRG